MGGSGFCGCFCGGSSSNLFQVSWQRAGSNASGRSGAGRSLYFVAPAGRNGSSERVFRGFSPGASEKNPFGRASSEAGGEAVNEALPKGLLIGVGGCKADRRGEGAARAGVGGTKGSPAVALPPGRGAGVNAHVERVLKQLMGTTGWVT
jgi:hypothetical protein